jgi:hypothetical protein
MRIEWLKGTAVAFGLSAALVPWTVARASDAKEEPHPSLTGRWELVPDKSDDPGQAVDFLVSPRQEGGGFPGAGGPQMGGGRGGRGGMGGMGGMGGRGGMGGMGGGGWGRGAHGGMDGEFTPPTPEERAAMHEAVESAIKGAATMDIVDSGSGVTIRLPEGRQRHFTTDGKKIEANRIVQEARWKKGQLEIKTETRRVKIKESWSLGPEPDQLSVEARAKRGDTDGELLLKRVYRKAAAAAAAPAPPGPAALPPPPPPPPPPGAPPEPGT